MTQLLNEDGTELGYPRFLKFVGDGVTTAVAGKTATVTVAGGVSGSPSYILIAGSDAPSAVIDAADYACDGTADQVEINTALALTDSRPIILHGTFTTTAAIAFTDGVKHDLYGVSEDGTVIQGNHTGNVLEIHSASTPCEWRITVANLHIDKGTSTPARGLSVTNGAYLTFRNVRARRCTTNHYCYFGVHNAYYDCMFTDGATGTQLTGAASAYSNLNRFYNCVWRANDVGTLFSTRTERCSFFGCGWEDMASTDVGVKFAADTTIRGHGFTDCWYEGVGASVYPMEFLGGRNISFVRPRFAIANTQAVVKVSGFAGKNVTIVDPHVDDGASLAGLPQGISVTSAGDNRTFNVTAFSALCDGTTDDTDAIQQAIDAAGTTGGTITGPKGTYLLSRQGAISHDSLTTGYCLKVDDDSTHGPIVFDFPRGTIFKLAASQAANSSLLVINGTSAAYRNAPTTIRGITWDGNYTNGTQTTWTDHGLITAVYAADVVIDQCKVQDYPIFGIHALRDCRGFRMTHNRLDGTHSLTEGTGCSLRIESNGAHIEGNTFVVDALAGRAHIQAGDNADILMQMHGLRLIGNEFHGGYNGSAVNLSGVSHSFVIGNLFRDVCDTSGWALVLNHYTNANGTFWDCADNVVEGNIFFNVRQGINLSGNAANNFSYSNSGGSGTTAYGAGAVRNKVRGNIITRDPEVLRTQVASGTTYPARTFSSYNYFQAPNAAPVNLATGIQEIAVSKFTGTATAGAASTLTDSGKTFTTANGGLLGCALYITGGTGVGQMRIISSNTGTVLTVGQAWDTVPDTTSTYEVCDPTGGNEIIGNTVVATSNSTNAFVVNTPSFSTIMAQNVSYNTTAPFTNRNNRSWGNRGYKGNYTGATGGYTTAQYRDENSGTASVTSGNTSVTVTHGCGRTPTADQVMVWPITTNGSATEWWVDTIGATTFVINVDANPAATYSFGWRIFGAM